MKTVGGADPAGEADLLPFPHWVEGVQEAEFRRRFPRREVLQGSLFYPACGLHGGPVRHMGREFQSFVYCDYGVTRDELIAEYGRRGFRGYREILRRDVSWHELTGSEIHSPAPEGCMRRTTRRPPAGWVKPFFALWSIFERDLEFGAAHGPARFSMLYLCMDGVSAYEALFNTNKFVPKGVAVIQPGTGFGGNYTAFEDPRDLLHRAVSLNPVGSPTLLLYGGWSDVGRYLAPCWPEYPDLLASYGGFSGGFSVFGHRRNNA